MKNIPKFYKKIIAIAFFAAALSVACLASYTYADSFVWNSILYTGNTTNAGGLISDDGMKILIAKNSTDATYTAGPDAIYMSVDGGATWSLASDLLRYWTSVSATDDFSNIIATAEERTDPNTGQVVDGGVYHITSSGTTRPSAGSYTAAAISNNGHVVAVGLNQTVIYSSNYGQTFDYAGHYGSYYSSLPVPHHLNSVALSANGQIGYIGDGDDYMYKTSDFGVTWDALSTNSNGSVPRNYANVATDDTGSIVYATRYDQAEIIKSTDGGASWSFSNPIGGATNSTSVRTNSSGSVVIIGYSSGYVYISTDGGVTYTQEYGGLGATAWNSVYVSKSGLRALVTSSNAYVYQGLFPQIGRYYNDAVGDHDISNLNNWWLDSSFTIHANTLPGSSDDIDIYGNATVNNGSMTLGFNAINVHGTANVNLSMSAIGSDGVNFYDSSSVYGPISGTKVSFHDSSYTTGGDINGPAYFYDSSSEGGATGGAVTFIGDDSTPSDTSNGPYTRVYDSTITTSRNFTGLGAPWTVIARGAVVTLSNSDQYDNSTVFQNESGGSFVYPPPPPPNPTDAPDLDGMSDSGVSNSDNITNDTTPTFIVGSCSPGDAVNLYAIGSSSQPFMIGSGLCNGGTAGVTSDTLSDGTYPVYTTDSNMTSTSTGSGLIYVTIDTAGPHVDPVLPVGGSTMTGLGGVQYTLDENIDIGHLNIAQVGGAFDTGHQCVFIGSGLSAGSHDINLADTVDGCVAASALTDGSVYDFHFSWTDIAGNVTEHTESGVTFDSRDYVPPTIDITSPSNGQTINGNAFPVTVNVSDDRAVVGVSYYYNGSLVDDETSSPYTFYFDTTQFNTPSPTPLIAVARDASNNRASTSVTLAIDNTPPSQPGAPDLWASSDTGTLPDDNITNDTNPIFDIGCAVGEQVYLYDENSMAIASGACPSNGHVALTYNFTEGNHAVTATRADTVGNMSGFSEPLAFTVDTTLPEISYVVASTSDGSYGVGTVIGITANFSDPVSISNPLTLTLETGNTDRTCALSRVNSMMATCNYTVQAGDSTDLLTVSGVTGSITDIAGNAATDGSIVIDTNLPGSSNNIIIDTTAPAAPSNFDAAVDGNNGAATLTWNNPADSSFANVTIRRSASGYPTSATSGIDVITGLSDTTYYDAPLSTGIYYYSIFAKDYAGNYSAAAHKLVVVPVPGDVTAPTIVGAAANGNHLVVTFSEPINPNDPNPYNYIYHIGNAGEYPDSVAPVVSGNTVTLTLNESVVSSDVLSLDYVKTYVAHTRDFADNDLENIFSVPVMNITPVPGSSSGGLASTQTVGAGGVVTSTGNQFTVPSLIMATSTKITITATTTPNGLADVINANTPVFSGTYASATQAVTGIFVQKQFFITSSGIIYQFAKNLELGSADPSSTSGLAGSLTVQNTDVKKLQVFLNSTGYLVAAKGPGSIGLETSKFGPGTKAALLKFQKAVGIKGANGMFGPATRAYINNLLKSTFK